jgi:hypothetical protein
VSARTAAHERADLYRSDSSVERTGPRIQKILVRLLLPIGEPELAHSTRGLPSQQLKANQATGSVRAWSHSNQRQR